MYRVVIVAKEMLEEKSGKAKEQYDELSRL